jgi:hypothetical protein
LIGDVLDRFVFQFRDEMDRGLVLILSEMAIDAIIAGVDLAADIPLPERSIAGVERLVPAFVPIQEIGILVEAVGKLVQRKSLKDVSVGQVGLGDKTCRRVVLFLFLPMDRNLSFRNIVLFCDLCCHFPAPGII